LEVSPEALFNELFTKVFRSSLFELSSHQHGNFVVQALISYASNQDVVLCLLLLYSTEFFLHLFKGDQLSLSTLGLVAECCMYGLCLMHFLLTMPLCYIFLYANFLLCLFYDDFLLFGRWS